MLAWSRHPGAPKSPPRRPPAAPLLPPPTHAATGAAAATSELAQLSVEGPTLSFIATCPTDVELFNLTAQPAANISPAAQPAADAPTATTSATEPTLKQTAPAWSTLDIEVTAQEAEWIVCPAPLATSSPVAPPPSSSSRAAGLPGRALRSCTAAVSTLAASLASLAHNLPHRRRRQQLQQQAAPQHPTLDLEITGFHRLRGHLVCQCGRCRAGHPRRR